MRFFQISSHLQINVVRYSHEFRASAKRIEKPNALSTYIGVARDFISSGWKCVVLFFHSLASTSFSNFVFIHYSTELNFDFIYKRVEHRTIYWFLLHYRFYSVLILFLNHGKFFNIWTSIWWEKDVYFQWKHKCHSLNEYSELDLNWKIMWTRPLKMQSSRNMQMFQHEHCVLFYVEIDLNIFAKLFFFCNLPALVKGLHRHN